MEMFAFKYVFCISYIAQCHCLIQLNMYKSDSFLGGYDCPTGDLVMIPSGVRSSSDCMQICTALDDCASVFYALQNGIHVCRGCNKNYTSSDAGILPLYSGTTYYRVPPSVGNSYCDFVWNSTCYKVTTTIGTWHFGKTSCATEFGAYPVTIETEAESAAIMDQLKNVMNPGNVWIGMYRAVGATNYVWDATGDIALESTVWFPWIPNEPHNSNTIENCILCAQAYAYMWADPVVGCLCDYLARMLCEVNL